MHTASHVGPQTPQTSRPAQHATGATTLAMNITMNVIYISLANIPTFFAEKVVCVSEQAEGLYSGLAYLLASTVSSIPVAAVSILAGTLIQYLITGPDPVYYRWYLFPEVPRGVRTTPCDCSMASEACTT